MSWRSFLSLSPTTEPLWVCLRVREIDAVCAAMLVADGVTPPAPGELKDLGFFAETAEDAELAAKAYLGQNEPRN